MTLRNIWLGLYKLSRRLLSGRGLGRRFSFVRGAHESLLKLLKSDFAEVQGTRMFLDANDSLGLSINGIYEPFETELFSENVKPGDVVLDVGANIGYYTLLFARLVGRSGRVFAFEPDPENADLLERNITINNYQNVVLVRKAVSNKNGGIRLYLANENKGDHRIYDSAGIRPFIEIESIRLDDYFKDFRRNIDLIKMDIQGAEPGAIDGALSLLERNPNVKLVSEFWPYGIRKFGATPESYIDRLIRCGFRLYELHESPKSLIAVNKEELIARCSGANEETATNLLCLKGESVNGL